MLRFYKKHILASKLFLFNKETQVELFFESVFRKSNCSGNQSLITGVCILTQFHIVGKPLNSKHPASPVHLHVLISTIESLLKLTPACSRNTWIDDRV